MRNLAMRASEAAKNTSDLIEGTAAKVREGFGLVKKTNEAFGNVSESATRSAELVAEIAAASGEQAQGIDQVSKAMSEMDKVTQQNAANAEESASAGEELNAQAEQMQSFVEKLVSMVGGSVNGGRRRERKTAPEAEWNVRESGALPRGIGNNSKGKHLAIHASREISADVALDGADFKDF